MDEWHLECVNVWIISAVNERVRVDVDGGVSFFKWLFEFLLFCLLIVKHFVLHYSVEK